MADEKIELFDEQGRSRGFYSQANRVNELTGREWVYWTKSVITQSYPPNMQHKLRSRHGAQKPPQLCADLIQVFTKSGQTVLDPFAGVGGTLLGAALCDRKALGVEINPEWVDVYREVCRLEQLPEQRMLCGEAEETLGRLAGEGFAADFVLTDVPYWSMDKTRRSKGRFKRVGEPSRERRRSKLSTFNPVLYDSKQDWLAALRRVFRSCLDVLRERAYLAVFIGDMYHSGRYHFLSADLAAALSELPMDMKANIIWYDVSKSLHVYGYRYEYIPSLIHQNILVYRKRAGSA